jgi:hypothetical protein
MYTTHGSWVHRYLIVRLTSAPIANLPAVILALRAHFCLYSRSATRETVA